MNTLLRHNLNEIYKPLCQRCDELLGALQAAGERASWGFYNLHETKTESGFLREYFPIPVIEVAGFGDIGIELDSLFAEMVLPGKAALSLDFSQIPYPYEVYGVEDYLADFGNSDTPAAECKARIAASEEENVAIGLQLPQDISVEAVLKLVKLCKKWRASCL